MHIECCYSEVILTAVVTAALLEVYYDAAA